MRKKLTGALVVGTAVAGIAVGGVAVAGTGGAVGTGDEDRPITGSALEQASAAALEHAGGGTVTETEVGDDESYYEVEVDLADGRELDVHLDRQFAVVGDDVDEADEADDADDADDTRAESGDD
jgi:hypothetical protein